MECHGTGTQAGDWRELKAISETVSQGRSSDHPVVVGSLKPNIGHLEGAAGVAGMIKGILVLEHGKIPPQANYDTPNPDMDLQGWRVKVCMGCSSSRTSAKLARFRHQFSTGRFLALVESV